MGHDTKSAEQEQSVKPKDWKEARSQPRVRPQWDPVAVAKEYLDDMEAGGRLQKRNPPRKG